MTKDPGQIGFARLRHAVERLGHPWDSRAWALNLVGIRAADRDSNHFNDTLAIAWYQSQRPILVTLSCTTDPGIYWRRHPMNPRGTAILAPGHHAGMWGLGLHRGQYAALVQQRPCTVYRDADRDDQLDNGPADHGLFGINLHRAADSYDAPQTIDRWSAGCQVIPDTADFELLMSLGRKHARMHGNRFDYTLIEEDTLWTQ